MWGVPPLYNPRFQYDRMSGMIIPFWYRYPELNNGIIGIDVPVNKRMDNPFLNPKTLKDMRDTLDVANRLMQSHHLPGVPYGPFTRQCPLNFDVNSDKYLEDLSYVTPQQYNTMLDDFIRDNAVRLTGTMINNIDENLRRAFRIYLWVVTKRYRMTGGKIDEAYLWMPATVEEVNEVLLECRYWFNCWQDAENKWLYQCRMSGTQHGMDFLKQMSEVSSANIIRKTIIAPWREEIWNQNIGK